MHTINRPTAVILCLLISYAAFAGEPSDSEIPTLRFIESNGIRTHVAEMGEGPLVIFLHGYPSYWYSWKDQLPAIADAGYHAVAPDRRGIGKTDAPEAVEDYNVLEQSADIVGIIDALGEKTAIVVGHDSGSLLAWHCAALHPDRFSAVVMLSIPFPGRSDAPYVAGLKRRSGDKFNYVLYFQEPDNPEAELDADPRGFFRGVIGFCSDVPRKDPEVTDPRRSAGGIIPRFGVPERLPEWFGEEDLDHYVVAYKESGFRGMLNGYRNLDRDWELTPELAGVKIGQPTLFIGGKKDHILAGFSNKDAIRRQLLLGTKDLRDVHVITECRHFVHMQNPNETNRLLLEFLRDIREEE
ncbi:MAG: alpha/beta hydrolase [Planctomycetota bacterium]